MRSFLAVLTMFVFAASAEPLDGSTGDYGNDLGQVLVFAKGLPVWRDICSERFPDLASSSTAALKDWETQNAETLREISERWQSYVEEASGGNVEKRAAIVGKLNDDAQQAEVAVRGVVAKLPGERVRGVCLDLPWSMALPERRLEVAMRYQLETVRKRPFRTAN